MTPPKTRKPGPDAQRGSVLSPNAAIEQEYTAVILTLIRRMCDETKKALQAVFSGEARPELAAPHALDEVDDLPASISAKSRVALNAIMDKYEPLFNRWAKKATKRMMDRTVKNSGVTLGMSLRQMSAAIQLDAAKMSPALLEIISASTTEAVSLIKLIPAQYLTKVQGAVSRSITTGNGLQDLVPFLEKQYQGNVRHARNVAIDQTRKAYNGVNAGRMSAIGVKTYEWIHTSGSREPRQVHIALNGKVCSLDDPPYIGEMYGEAVYGKPGDLPLCRCRMRPILDFSDD
jgi:SPP1 gp7 family putative phage head morphogenesis protein